jgi:hypothetical protein
MAVVCAVVLAGCDKLFGASPVSVEDAQRVADSNDDGSTDAPNACANPATIAITTDGDGYFRTDMNGQLRLFGSVPLVQLDASAGQDALWRFVLPVPANRIVKARLNLTVMSMDMFCGVSCSSACNPIAGDFNLFPARSDWVESGFNYFCLDHGSTTPTLNCPNINDRWQGAGATGAMDRGAFIKSVHYANTGDLSIDLIGADITTIIDFAKTDTSLSLLAEAPPTSKIRLFVSAKEQTCVTASPATLLVTYCR